MTIDLRHAPFASLLADAPKVDAVVADPPWAYNRAPGDASYGGAILHKYEPLSAEDIASELDAAYDLCPEAAYLVVWCTWPKLIEWTEAARAMRWRYVTGGAWVKSNGFGVGFHAAGDSEFALYYVKGSPRPADGRQSNGWHAPRGEHSEKPAHALDRIVRTVAPRDGLILDPYAGETGSLAAACLRNGRRYLGTEIDSARHRRALRRLHGESAKQARMVGQMSLLGSRP